MGYQKLTPIIATGSSAPRYLGDRFADIVNVMDFGAVGDGATDDAAAFSAAVTAGAGKPVFVPAGTYMLSEDVDGDFYSLGDVTITGAGEASVINIVHDVAQLESKIFNAVATGSGESTVNVQSDDRFFFLEFKSTAYEYFSSTLSEQTGFGGLLFKDLNGDLAGSLRFDRGTGTGSSWYQLALWTPDTNTKCAVYMQGGDTKSFHPQGNNLILLGKSGSRWSAVWAATGSIQTSDERLKSNIEQFGDDVLDAWGDVNFVKFQYNDSLQEKGSSARLHSGLVAQHIEQAFRRRGLDASRYGLFCWDEWEADPEKGVEEAGECYSLRYDEALCMEAAYQRRRADRLEARLAELEERVAQITGANE